MTNFDKTAHSTKWIPVKNLSVVWANAQREFDEKHAEHISDNFDPDMFGTLAVTKANGDGVYHVIDGQHRKAAMQSLYGDDERVPCNIFDADDPSRAAKIFDKINTHRKRPQPIDTFKVRVTAGHEVESAVDRIVKEAGYRIANEHGKEGVILAANALVSVYRSYTPDTLKSTLTIIQATWGMDPNSVVAPMIRGYGAFLAEYGGEANWQRLAHNVKKKFTPGQFLAAAKNMREIRRRNTADAVRYVLITTYNAGLKSGHIGKPEHVA